MTAGPESGSGVRHLTATGFVVWQSRVLLHWHRRERAWFPPGGHLEENEDPVQCVLREIEEESGIRAELLQVRRRFAFEYPPQLPRPVTILIERVGGAEPHEHIDLIYYCRPVGDPPLRFLDPTIRWLNRAQLESNHPVAPLDGEPPARVPEDVRILALDAIEWAESTAANR